MKVRLFGGAEDIQEQFAAQLKLMEIVIKEINPSQIFHIPFARSPETELALGGKNRFPQHVNLDGIEYLNADNEVDVKKAKSPLVLITGGRGRAELLEKIKTDPRLLQIVNNARYLIGESSGAMILGSHVRIKTDTWKGVVAGLNIVKDTIIKPHYAQRQSQELLQNEMNQAKVKYGIGIDCATAIELEVNTFPHEYKKIGEGTIEIKKKSST